LPTDKETYARLVALEMECGKLRRELGIEGHGLPLSVPPPSEPGIYRVLARSASDFLSVHSADGRCVFASPACEPLFGWKPEELLGTSPYEYIHPEDLEAAADIHRRHLGGEGLLSLEYRLRKRCGSHIWVEVRSQIYDNHHGQRQIVCVTRDISEQRRLREEKETLIEELRQRVAQMREVGDFLPMCSWCKSVRDEDGRWHEVDAFLRQVTGSELTHAMCPCCANKAHAQRSG